MAGLFVLYRATVFSRKNQKTLGSPLPNHWPREVESILGKSYLANLKNSKKKFVVTGRTYPDELWVAFSLLPESNSQSPITYIVSMDIQESIGPQKTLTALLDSAGLFFDFYFNRKQDDQNCYSPQWTKSDVNGQEFFYAVTRENIELSMEAERILRDGGS